MPSSADTDQDQEQHAGDAIDQGPGFGRAARLRYSAEDGHEGLRECALGKHAAQQVGQAEGDEEGVGHHAGAEGAGDDEVAHEAQDARQQGHAADGGQGAEQVHAGMVSGMAGRSRLQWAEDPLL
jgi:hypothetical protein